MQILRETTNKERRVQAATPKRTFVKVTSCSSSKMNHSSSKMNHCVKCQVISLPQKHFYSFCQKPLHSCKKYRYADHRCLACGSNDHMLENYPQKKSIGRVLPNNTRIMGTIKGTPHNKMFLHTQSN